MIFSNSESCGVLCLCIGILLETNLDVNGSVQRACLASAIYWQDRCEGGGVVGEQDLGSGPSRYFVHHGLEHRLVGLSCCHFRDKDLIS